MKVKILCVFIAVTVILTIGLLLMFFMKIKTNTDTDRITLPTIDDVPKEYWTKLAKKKIFFGHQSVGYNIIDGIKDVINEHDYIRLNIVETHNPAKFDHPIFAHTSVGRNTDPTSKINSFKDIMDAGVGNRADIAFFKFCYIDMMHDSQPQKIFDDYKDTVEALKTRYPETKFLHVTVPLRCQPKGAKKILKEFVKFLIGRPGVLDNNIKRNRYNMLLNETYSKTESVFDLALAESINPNSLRCYASKGAKKVFVMAPEYTYDGGHLNKEGRKKVAEQLLIMLARN